MSQIKILIADEMHPSLFDMLRKENYLFEYCPTIDREEILSKINDFEGLIIRSKTKIDKDFLSKTQSLQFVGRAGAGLDLIDIEEVTKKNIEIFAANEGNKIAVAEHTIGMVLALFNKITIANLQVKKKIWLREENRGIELFGKTIGIIGFGNNGSETAQRFAAFGCKVLVYDKYKSGFGERNIYESTMQQIFEEADLLSLHIPLTDETNTMVNSDFILKFNKPFYLINIARGEIVVMKDLVEALKSRKILGACLDVLENEKLNKLSTQQEHDFDFLSKSENVILTPHTAGWTHESYTRINEVLVFKINNFYSQKK